MAPPRRARAPYARPRRGSVERPINARLVRGTWLFVALPLLLAAFTVGRPQPLPAPTLPAAFDGPTAEQLARELARDYPDRSPGSAGSLGAAEWVSEQLALYRFPVQTDRFRGKHPRPRARRAPEHRRGRAGRLAARDRDRRTPRQQRRGAWRQRQRFGHGRADRARTCVRAACPASAVQPRPSHTLVFVSTDGGAFGALGAARFAEQSPYRGEALAVISLDAIAGVGPPRAAHRR